jgi:DNA-binding MarR family transcriptional regulator
MLRVETIRAATMAKRYLASRRRRDELACGLFSDPAWDILLDLFANSAEGRRISISSACIASGVPTSTAHLWVTKLEDQGLIVRRPDERDGRRTFLEITEESAAAVERWLNATFVN